MDNRIARAALVIILLCAAALRIYGVDFKSLEADEIFTVGIAAADNSLLDVLSMPLYNTPVAKPALYFLVTHFFLCLEDHDFLLRFPSLAFGMLGIAATYAVGAALFGRKEGLVAAFLLCISPLNIRYSQMARFYPLLMTFSLLSLYFLYRGILKGGRRSWVGFIVASILNLYTHLFAFLVLLAESLFFVFVWLRGLVTSGRVKNIADNQGHGLKSLPWVSVHRRAIFILIASLMIIALAYAPMIPHIFGSLVGSKGIVEEGETPGLELSPSFFGGLLTEWSTGPGIGPLIFLVLFLIGVLASLRNRGAEISLVALWMVVPFIVLFAVPLQHRFYPRYLVFLLPIYLLVIARGLTASDDLVARTLKGSGVEKYGRYWVGLAIGLVVLSALSVSPLQGYYREKMSDWRAAAVFLGNTMSPGETIIVRRPANQLALLHYDERLEGVEFSVLRPRDPLPADLEYQRGIWFVGKEGRNGEMSRLEEELVALTEGSVFRTIFEGHGDHYLPGAGESMFWDVWVLYTR